MKKRFIICIAVLAAAAFSLFGCSGAAQSATGAARIPSITASGKGEVMVTPDTAYINVGVTTQNADAKMASDLNSAKMNALFDAVKAVGIADEDIKTVNYSINPMYDYSNSKPTITGYTASNIVRITVRDIQSVSSVIDAAVAAGSNDIQNISFDLLDKSQAYADALTAAVNDAKSKVDVMAAAVGITQTSPLTIVESSTTSYPIYNSAPKLMADMAEATPISQGQMSITANVTVEYKIQ